MAKTNRWMTWVLEESAKTEVSMPWARGANGNWKSRLTEDAPSLSLNTRAASSVMDGQFISAAAAG